MKKFFKLILIIIILFLIVYAGSVIRNVVILTNLDNKVEKTIRCVKEKKMI